MTKISRSRDPRYMEIVDRGTRKYVRDQVVLADEILSLLATYGEFTRSRLCVMVGANGPLVETVLIALMGSGQVSRIKRPGPHGQPYFFWSAVDSSGADSRFNLRRILAGAANCAQ